MKNADKNVRIGWKDPTELKAFCDLCAAQVLNGKKNGGYLRKEGVDAVIKQLGEMGKVVTHMQFKNKWDHLRKQWKTWKEVFEHETGLSYDPITRKTVASDEWWTRKLEACSKASTFKNKRMPNVESMEIMFEGTVATEKNAVCAGGKIPKEPRKKHSIVQEIIDSSESRSVSIHTPFASTAANEVQAIMDMVLTLPGVQFGDRLYNFSTCFFLGNQEAKNMFVAQRAQKEIQLRWLEKQYQMHPQFHL